MPVQECEVPPLFDMLGGRASLSMPLAGCSLPVHMRDLYLKWVVADHTSREGL